HSALSTQHSALSTQHSALSTQHSVTERFTIMAANRVYNYEGVFIIGQAVAVDLQGAVDHVKEILAKAGAEIFAMKKWDERRFAYEIKKQKRGVYLLVYFSCPAPNLAQIERS